MDERCCELSDISPSVSSVYPLQTGGNTGSELTITLANPAPADGCPVDLRVEGLENTGGHRHSGGRPSGSLDVTHLVIPHDETTVQTNYTSGEFGGLERVYATTTGNEKWTTLTVAVPNLAPLSSSSYYRLTGQLAAHPDNHYGSYFMLTKVEAIAEEFYNTFNATLGINDMSLERGGGFDISGNWQAPHVSHRKGTSVDIDRKALWPKGLKEVPRQRIEKICIDYGGHLAIEKSIHCEIPN